MKYDIGAILDNRVRAFFALYGPQHQILCDFFTCLTEEQYDFRMVDRPDRKAETPRESLAHVLYVELVYLNAVQTGRLEFKSMGTEGHKELSKRQLLAEMERVDRAIYETLTGPDFDSDQKVGVPWGGEMNTVDLLFFLRDHDILHIGWNLAYMDHLDVPRYETLIQYWGP